MTEKTEDPEGIENVDFIKISKFFKDGMMLTNRECVGWNHPEQMYNYVKKKLQDARAHGDGGVNADGEPLRPEDFGIKNPKSAEFEKYSRNELIDEIVELRELVDSYEINQVPFKCSR